MNFKDELIHGNFKQCGTLIKQMSKEQIREELLEIAYDEQGIETYAFVCYLLRTSPSSAYHLLASELLAFPLVFMKNAYNISYYHAKAALELAPHDLSIKEYYLFFNTLQEPLLPDDEAIIVAENILEIDPTNETALNLLREKAGDV